MKAIATTPAAPSEAGVIAGELVRSFGQLVRVYEKHFGLSHEDAIRRAADVPEEVAARALSGPPDQVSWLDLHAIASTDPDRATARWEEIKRAALDELSTGHRAAAAVETPNDDAWQRARFLALREELSAEWQPRNGVERQLVDTMAQAQQGFLHWLRTLTVRTSLESVTNDRLQTDEGKWGPPRQSDADAVDQAAAMMDRFHKMYMRTLRALCDMRRHCGRVIVKKGGQMNVAQQQVNVLTDRPEGGYNSKTGKTARRRSSGRG